MYKSIGTALALGAIALTGAATAQTNVEPDHEHYTTTNPILSADFPGASSFTLRLDPETNQACYILNALGLPDDAIAAHVHKGGLGESGAPVIPLKTPVGGASGGCVTIDAALLKALSDNPGGYYVNVHTKSYPGGYLRGQLEGDAFAG